MVDKTPALARALVPTAVAKAGVAHERLDGMDVGAFQVPAGYRVTRARGVELLTLKTVKGEEVLKIVPVCPSPIWIGAIYANPAGGEKHIQVCCHLNGRTIRSVVANRDLVGVAGITRLAEDGFVGLHTGNLRGVLTYLGAAILANEDKVTQVVTAGRLGMERDAKGAPVAFVHDALRSTIDNFDTPVERAPSHGIPQETWEAYTTHGTPDGWAEMFSMVRSFRLSSLYAVITNACASLLNREVDAMPLLLHLGGEAAHGKTTALRIASSVVGRPATVVATMRGTANGMEGLLRAAGDLPVFLDEAGGYGSGPNQTSALGGLIRMVSDGSGNRRMSRNGSARETARFSCNAIVTGELDIGAVGADTGVRRRVMTLWGSPFGQVSDAGRALAQELDRRARDNYGHAIRTIGKKLVLMSEADRDALRAEHGALVEAWMKLVPEGTDANFAAAFAAQFASMEIVGTWLATVYLARPEVGAMPSPREMLTPAFRQVVAKVKSASRVERVVAVINEYIATHRDEIQNDALPGSGAAGRILRGRITETQVFLAPQALSDFLQRADFALATENEHLKTGGYLIPDKAGKSTQSVRLGEAKMRCMVFDRRKLEGGAE